MEDLSRPPQKQLGPRESELQASSSWPTGSEGFSQGITQTLSQNIDSILSERGLSQVLPDAIQADLSGGEAPIVISQQVDVVTVEEEEEEEEITDEDELEVDSIKARVNPSGHIQDEEVAIGAVEITVWSTDQEPLESEMISQSSLDAKKASSSMSSYPDSSKELDKVSDLRTDDGRARARASAGECDDPLPNNDIEVPMVVEEVSCVGEVGMTDVGVSGDVEMEGIVPSCEDDLSDAVVSSSDACSVSNHDCVPEVNGTNVSKPQVRKRAVVIPREMDTTLEAFSHDGLPTVKKPIPHFLHHSQGAEKIVYEVVLADKLPEKDILNCENAPDSQSTQTDSGSNLQELQANPSVPCSSPQPVPSVSAGPHLSSMDALCSSLPPSAPGPPKTPSPSAPLLRSLLSAASPIYHQPKMRRPQKCLSPCKGASTSAKGKQKASADSNKEKVDYDFMYESDSEASLDSEIIRLESLPWLQKVVTPLSQLGEEGMGPSEEKANLREDEVTWQKETDLTLPSPKSLAQPDDFTSLAQPPSSPHAGTGTQPSASPHATQPSAAPQADTETQPSASPHAGTEIQPSASPHAGTETQPSASPHAGTEIQPSASPHAGTETQPSASPHAGTETQLSASLHAGTEIQPSASPHAGTETQPSASPHAGTETQLSASLHAGTEIQPSTSLHVGTKTQLSGSPHAGTETQPSASPHAGTETQPSASPHAGTETQLSASLHAGTEIQPSASPHAGTETQPSASPHAGTEIQPSASPHAGTKTQLSASLHAGTEIQPSASLHIGTKTQLTGSPHAGTETQPSASLHAGTVTQPSAAPHVDTGMEASSSPHASTGMELSSPPHARTGIKLSLPPHASIGMEVSSPPHDNTGMELFSPPHASTAMEVFLPPSTSTEMKRSSPPHAGTGMELSSSPHISTGMELSSPPHAGTGMELSSPPHVSTGMELFSSPHANTGTQPSLPPSTNQLLNSNLQDPPTIAISNMAPHPTLSFSISPFAAPSTPPPASLPHFLKNSSDFRNLVKLATWSKMSHTVNDGAQSQLSQENDGAQNQLSQESEGAQSQLSQENENQLSQENKGALSQESITSAQIDTASPKEDGSGKGSPFDNDRVVLVEVQKDLVQDKEEVENGGIVTEGDGEDVPGGVVTESDGGDVPGGVAVGDGIGKDMEERGEDEEDQQTPDTPNTLIVNVVDSQSPIQNVHETNQEEELDLEDENSEL